MSIPRFWRYRGKIIDIENEDCELGTLQEIAAEVLELRASNTRLRESCERVLALFLVLQQEYDEIRFHGETKCATLKIADIVNDLSAAVATARGEPDAPQSISD